MATIGGSQLVCNGRSAVGRLGNELVRPGFAEQTVAARYRPLIKGSDAL